MSSTPQRIVNAILQRADFLLQSRFCLVQPFFADDPAAAESAGVYSAEDWHRARQRQTEPRALSADRYASDEAYRRYLAAIHESKIQSVRSLARAFDFRSYGRILELGCGDMPQAFTVCSQFPDIRYTATDFDPCVIADCARLPLLSGIRKLVLDVTRDDLSLLQDHDLVISWSLEFSLNDAQMVSLFAACRKHSVPYLLCTHTDMGPIDYFRRAYRLKRQGKPAAQQGQRMLGWLRSAGEIVRLAKQAGMALNARAYHVNHAALFFKPA